MKSGREKESIAVYLPFPDGVFHYVCKECTMVCCHRSSEFDGRFGNEIQQLVQLYPAMEITAVRRRGDVLAFATPTGRCYFLDEDDRCGVEKRHGKEMKPITCTVFPFNNYFRLGKTFVAGINFLCPLRLQVPASPGAVEGTHSTVEALLRGSTYLEGGYYESVKSLRLRPDQKPADVLAEEIAFRDACARGLGLESFAATRNAASDTGNLEGHLEWAAGLLGLSLSLRPATRDRVDDLLLAIAPMLRLNMLALVAEERLRVLALGELVLRRLLTLTGQESVSPADASTPKGAFELLSRLAPAMQLLAISDKPVTAGRNAARRVPPFGDPQMTFAAFDILRTAEKGQPLTGALERNLSSLSVANRMALLMDMASSVGSAALVAKPKSRAAKRSVEQRVA